mmetsp:Transcript_22633/g.69094  ORF Transcript_22633/g.69094 Transcript_22633/m.69094 type:complete len:204 (+) Transcript_22633:1042-1653(+)
MGDEARLLPCPSSVPMAGDNNGEGARSRAIASPPITCCKALASPKLNPLTSSSSGESIESMRASASDDPTSGSSAVSSPSSSDSSYTPSSSSAPISLAFSSPLCSPPAEPAAAGTSTRSPSAAGVCPLPASVAPDFFSLSAPRLAPPKPKNPAEDGAAPSALVAPSAPQLIDAAAHRAASSDGRNFHSSSPALLSGFAKESLV